jgi:hypothetical protein
MNGRSGKSDTYANIAQMAIALLNGVGSNPTIGTNNMYANFYGKLPSGLACIFVTNPRMICLMILSGLIFWSVSF